MRNCAAISYFNGCRRNTSPLLKIPRFVPPHMSLFSELTMNGHLILGRMVKVFNLTVAILTTLFEALFEQIPQLILQWTAVWRGVVKFEAVFR
jgi:hypothetical protein